MAAPNAYSQITARLQGTLRDGLTLYGGLQVWRRQLRATVLPDFERYAIVVAPNGRPWGEKRIATIQIEYLFAIDLHLLVKNFDDELALFGTEPPTLGLFQFVDDVKDVLRATDLDGLLAKTYDEVSAPVEIEATPGFDAGEHTFVHRARLVFQCRTEPFCHARVAQ